MQKEFTNDKEFFEKIPFQKRGQYLSKALQSKQISGDSTPLWAKYQRIEQWKHNNFDFKYHISEMTDKPKAILLFFHGLNSHGETSGYLAKMLTEQIGINVAALDMKNFGRSNTDPNDFGYIQSFDRLVEDAEAFIDFILSKYATRPKVFIAGLSMGGMISFKVAVRNKQNFDGVIMLSAALRDNYMTMPFLKKFIGLGYYFPRVNISAPDYSRDTRYDLKEFVMKDKYAVKSSISSGTGYQLFNAISEIQKSNSFEKLNVPYLCIQAGVDFYVDLFAPLDLEKESKSKDKTTVYYKDMWHVFYLEPEHHQITMRIVQWIKERI